MQTLLRHLDTLHAKIPNFLKLSLSYIHLLLEAIVIDNFLIQWKDIHIFFAFYLRRDILKHNVKNPHAERKRRNWWHYQKSIKITITWKSFFSMI